MMKINLNELVYDIDNVDTKNPNGRGVYRSFTIKDANGNQISSGYSQCNKKSNIFGIRITDCPTIEIESDKYIADVESLKYIIDEIKRYYEMKSQVMQAVGEWLSDDDEDTIK